MNYCIVIFSYDDGDLAKIPISKALSSRASSIIFAGGGKAPYDFISTIEDERFIPRIEDKRIGKSSALLGILKFIQEDVTFLVSGDISFGDEIFEQMMREFDESTGVVVPRISLADGSGLWWNVSKVLWDIHDSQLTVLSQLSENSHGGELIAIKTSLLKGFRDVINDDAFLCISAANMGLSVKYLDSAVVKSISPRSFLDLVVQRRRINYGHLELLRMRMDPKVMDTLLFTDPSLFMLIMNHFLKKHREDLIFLPLTIFCEFISMTLSRIDFATGKSHKIWKIVPRIVP